MWKCMTKVIKSRVDMAIQNWTNIFLLLSVPDLTGNPKLKVSIYFVENLYKTFIHCGEQYLVLANMHFLLVVHLYFELKKYICILNYQKHPYTNNNRQWYIKQDHDSTKVNVLYSSSVLYKLAFVLVTFVQNRAKGILQSLWLGCNLNYLFFPIFSVGFSLLFYKHKWTLKAWQLWRYLYYFLPTP